MDPINRGSSATNPINRRRGRRSSKDRVRMIRRDGKYYTSHPLLPGPFNSPRNAYRAARDRTQELLLTRYDLRSLRASMLRFLRAGSRTWSMPAPLSEKLVSAVAEAASSLALQEGDDSSTSSLQESICASPGTVPHNIIDASSRSSTSSCEKLAAGASESACAQTLGEADVSSLEVINTASLQELVTASPRTAPCNNTLDGSSTTFPLRHEKTVAGVTESARAQALRELDLELDQFIAEERFCISSSEDEATTTSLRAAQCNTIDGTLPSVSSKILSRRIPNCFYWYYIRMDRRGFFRMYPNLGGPFQSLEEAEDAINRHHDELWCQAWHNVQERAPGGGPYSSARKKSKADTYRYLVESILDQYNEDNNLIGDLVYELDEDSMMEQWICEGHSFYYHYNFTTKKNEADDALGICTFFAEVSHKIGEHALEVNCCCKMEDEDNGWCYGCKNNGSHGLRHPNNSDAYGGGHLDVLLPFDLEEPSSSDDEDTKETRLRNISEV